MTKKVVKTRKKLWAGVKITKKVVKTRKKIFRQTNGENDGEVGDQSEVWQTGVYANEMIKEYFEYSLNEKISRYSETVNSTKLFLLWNFGPSQKKTEKENQKKELTHRNSRVCCTKQELPKKTEMIW